VIDIHFLNNGFGLLKEYEGMTNSFISLVFLDLSRRSLQKLHTFEYPSRQIDIYVNKADPTTFLLNEGEFIRIFKVFDNTIIIGERIEIDFYPACFYDKCVYTLKGGNETRVSLSFICLINTSTFLDTSNLYLRC
jgi:hypothetical protein